MSPGELVAKRYRLERPLGSGGMGAVWAATHTVTYKAVALKFLHKKNDDEAARKRVVREARAASAVKHPNVVAVHDVIEDEGGTPVLVMDLLEGESLADKLAREHTLSPKEAIEIIRPLLSALGAAHAIGVVHRDLKPDNVFLVGKSALDVRILDFGVAKLSGKDLATKETNRLTETGAMIGTPHYMAPEQAFGEADVDARADLWAVGAVLYEMISGKTPADGDNLGQILKVLASGKIVSLGERAPDAPRELVAIVDDLLRIEKTERPSSAEAVLARVDALGTLSAERIAARGSDEPKRATLSVTPKPAARDTSPPKRTSPFAWAAGAVAVLLVGGGGLLTVSTFGRSPKPPPATPIAAAEPQPAPAPPPAASVVPAKDAPAAAASVTLSKPMPVKRAPAAKPAPAASAARSPLLDTPTF